MRRQIDFFVFQRRVEYLCASYPYRQRGARRLAKSRAAPLKNKKNDSMAQVTINMAPLRGLGRAVGHPCKEQRGLPRSKSRRDFDAFPHWRRQLQTGATSATKQKN